MNDGGNGNRASRRMLSATATSKSTHTAGNMHKFAAVPEDESRRVATPT